MAIVTDSAADPWRFQLSAAEQHDRWTSHIRTSVPPIQTPLISAAAATDLRRFHPFTSHNHLRFAAQPAHVLDSAALAPVSIAWVNEPDRYVVYRHEGVESRSEEHTSE